MALKLLVPKNDCRASKILVTAEMAGVKIDISPFEIGKDDSSQSFLEKSPLKRIPVLETPEGSVFMSNAILRYVARLRPASGLYGKTLQQYAEVDQWLDCCSNELDVPISCLVHGKAVERAVEDVNAFVQVLNQHLLHRTFVVGENITVADIAIVCILSQGIKANKLDSGIVRSNPNLQRWFETCVNQQGVKKVLGKVSLQPNTAEAAKPVAPPTTMDEEMAKPSKKPGNPLDSLPPSSLVLDEWKRKYSNTKKLYEEAMPWFWSNFDAAGWSIYYMKYEKLPDECTIGFVTSNQLGGFLQRIDPTFRKYSFGVIDVVGKDKDFDIQGIWMFRGTDIPFEMKDHPSYEYHIFRKLDVAKPEDKKLVEDYWCADEEVEGRSIVDSKVWK